MGKHRAQVLNYLKATGLELGLLINFGNPKKLEHERIVRFRSNETRSHELGELIE